MADADDKTKPRYGCPDCQKTFSRSEHLTRHQALHDGTQPHQCESCSKSFPRKDALTRHLLTHESGPNLLEKKARACRACARSKVRCSGERPCARCSTKEIECDFPEPRPHQRTASVTDLPSPDSQSRIGENELVLQTTRGSEQYGTPESPRMMRDHHDSMSRAGGLHEQRFNPSHWTPTVLSSINWLPLEFYNQDDTPISIAISPIETSQPSHTHIGTPQSVFTASDTLESLTSGGCYVDGIGGLPRTKRQKIRARRPSDLRSHDLGYRLSWNHPLDPSIGPHLADFEYESMRNAFATLCINCAPVANHFISADFPPREAFDSLIHVFFTNLHQTLPFVHRPTFNPDHDGRWILLLAMASASSWYFEDDYLDTFSESLLEFLRRVTLYFDGSNGWQRTFTNCRHAQIRLCFILSASASKNDNTKMWTDRCMSELCYSVNSAICRSYPKGQYERAGMPSNAEWLVWSEDEQTRRTAFLVWQIGFLRFMRHSEARAPVPLDAMAQIRLPCNDALFEAKDPDAWQYLEARHPRLTFLEALELLYVEKRLVTDLGDFSHILLTYGIVHRTREVEDQVHNPFARFEPSAERRRGSEIGTRPIWAPCEPLYTKWRNAGCDALDILHWQANAATRLARGLDPATVLHLHFSRMLMLSPLGQLINLAQMLNMPYPNSVETGRISPEEVELRRKIQRWAVSDQYKARLAAIHAGMTFWHIRRYSINAFYEPFAVLTATLTLWAISALTPRTRLPELSPRISNGSAIDRPEGNDVILIDRPIHDELVQDFVRKGQSMTPLMSGIDEGLWSPSAPFKILKEGTRLLNNLGAWSGEIQRAVDLLEGLAGARI